MENLEGVLKDFWYSPSVQTKTIPLQALVSRLRSGKSSADTYEQMANEYQEDRYKARSPEGSNEQAFHIPALVNQQRIAEVLRKRAMWENMTPEQQHEVQIKGMRESGKEYSNPIPLHKLTPEEYRQKPMGFREMGPRNNWREDLGTWTGPLQGPY